MKLQQFIYIIILSALITGYSFAQDQTDPNLWLENIDSAKALTWVKAHDKKTLDVLEKFPDFKKIEKQNMDILDSKERIAYPSIVGNYVYNFWQDPQHERGIWRRTKLDDYLSSPKWETLLDIDSMSSADNAKWVFKGANFLYPKFERCIVSLSKGGGDAVIKREYDPNKKEFIKDGFELPAAKSDVAWKDENTLFVGTDYGEGSMTQSGYPRIVKEWKRGTKLSDARTLYEGKVSDVSVSAFSIYTPEGNFNFINEGKTFYSSDLYYLDNEKLVKVDIPEDAQFDGLFKGQMLVELKSDWNTGGKLYKQGALIALDFKKFMNGNRDFEVVYQPDERSSITSISTTKNFLLINKLNNVKSELYKYWMDDGKWQSIKLDAPAMGAISIVASDDFTDNFFFEYRGFLSPSTLYFVSNGRDVKKIQSLPEYFNADKFTVEQFEATSKDGTKIPYFLIHAKNMKLDGKNPTLLYAYGGFEVSMLPFYSGTVGTAWLERGGVYAYANLRGGGEFGPNWHLQAIKENRQKVNDDMIAVSEDLINRKITSPRHLGIEGGSNGGLLVGSVFCQRPELYNAVVCQVPLLDMKRYNHLLAGASWMAEYGNPDDPKEWAYISKYSPYQNLHADKKYPKILLMTSTRDDRVHPGHARKFAARLEELKKPFYFYENTEGGHSAGVTNKQRAFESALVYSYLWMQLK